MLSLYIIVYVCISLLLSLSKRLMNICVFLVVNVFLYFLEEDSTSTCKTTCSWPPGPILFCC